MKFFVLLVCSMLIISCQTEKNKIFPEPLIAETPYSSSNSDSFWKTIKVEDTDLSIAALQEFIALCKETGASALVVVYKGKIVSEWYSERYREPIGAMSSTKVVASILIGQLADEGLLKYDSRVSSILKSWTGGLRDEVTISQLLTHSAGFNAATSNDKSIGYAPNKREFVLALYPDRKPGEKFEYSNEGIQLLEPIISEITKQDTGTYAKEKLFSKIGMNNTTLYDYGDSAWLYAEMKTTPRDMARIGLLMKRNGKWEGRQIVSSEYVAAATSPSKTSKSMGYAWWILDTSKTLNGYYASGYLNNDIYVFNDYDLVIVRMQAPINGYSGKNESGDYFAKAMKIFKRIVNK